jgi:membrane-bound ClpP family serine protease
VGLACLAIELLILPGFGIFGLGGVIMIIASLTLASQTFVLPHDSREVQAMISSIVGVLVACSGVVSGIVALRYFAHRVPLLRELVMPELTAEQFAERNQREAMVSWDHLLGQTGRAMTVLRPAGKARFGEDVVAVVADGAYVSAGERIRVIKVQGNRVSVERVEDA